MFGFGEMETTEQKTTTPNPFVSQAANNNLDFTQNLRDKGFQGYQGQQVTSLDPKQQASIDASTNIANNGTGAQAANLIGGYASAPAQNVQAQSIAQNMSPYMNQYVMQALAPQMHQMDLQDYRTRAATNATATASGAFGDARTGIEQANNAFNSNVAREGMIGTAYNNAFNTAINAGSQDANRSLTADQSNASYNEAAINRQLGGATALQGLQTQQQGLQTTANTLAQQNTAQKQAELTAQYNQWLMAQQYPFQTAGLVNQTVATANPANPSTVKTDKPDNSGYALIGNVAGAILSDQRVKQDIDMVGALRDGTPVYSYSYKADPHHRKQIGLMAQDVQQRRPDAVVTLDDPDRTMMVDYGKATERSRLLSISI